MHFKFSESAAAELKSPIYTHSLSHKRMPRRTGEHLLIITDTKCKIDSQTEKLFWLYTSTAAGTII